MSSSPALWFIEGAVGLQMGTSLTQMGLMIQGVKTQAHEMISEALAIGVILTEGA